MISEQPSSKSLYGHGRSSEKNLVPTCPLMIVFDRKVFLVCRHFRVGEVVGMSLKEGGMSVRGGGGIVEETMIL